MTGRGKDGIGDDVVPRRGEGSARLRLVATADQPQEIEGSAGKARRAVKARKTARPEPGAPDASPSETPGRSLTFNETTEELKAIHEWIGRPPVGLLGLEKSALSDSNEWATPRKLFDELSRRYGPFDLDASAAKWNAKAEVFFDKRANGLARSWFGRVWMNPPYSTGSLDAWMGKARAEVLAGRAIRVVCLIPCYTSEGWWHRHVEAPAGNLDGVLHRVDWLGATTRFIWRDLAVEFVRLKGRQKFIEKNGATGSARFASAVVVFESRF